MSEAGYWPAAWPVGGADSRRSGVTTGPGLDVLATDHLVATTRALDRRPVTFVQRGPGELYLSGGDDPAGQAAGAWVERVDPITLQPVAASDRLDAGGHPVDGSIAAHANGDLYTVCGSYLHRLDPQCRTVAATALPVDAAHRGLVVLGDGSIVTKDVQTADHRSTVTVLGQDLSVLARLELPERSVGRVATDPVGGIVIAGSTRLFRCRWDGSSLVLDDGWQPSYRQGRGGPAGDPVIADGRVWVQDNRVEVPPTGHGPDWADPVTVTGISLGDGADTITASPTEHPAGWAMAGPLVAAGALVTFDTANMGLAAFDLSASAGRPARRSHADVPDTPDMLWYQPFRTSMHPLLFGSTGELVVNDYRILSDRETSDDIVVLDLATGRMKARVATGSTELGGLFLTPGWDRDLYYCAPGMVARVQVVAL